MIKNRAKVAISGLRSKFPSRAAAAVALSRALSRAVFLLMVALSIPGVRAPSAWAMEFAFQGGVGLFSQNPLPSSTTTLMSSSGRPAFGFGGTVAFSLIPYGLDLETGLLWMPRKYSVLSSSALEMSAMTTGAFQSLQLPVILRVTALPVVSFGIGGYFAHAIGDLLVSDYLGNLSTSGFESQKLRPFDFGVLASVRGGMPVAPLVTAFAEFRYLQGLSEQSEGGPGVRSIKYREAQVFTGASFGF
jgi:hypothetical protein